MLKVGRSLAATHPCPGGTRNPSPPGGELDASAELGSPAAPLVHSGSQFARLWADRSGLSHRSGSIK